MTARKSQDGGSRRPVVAVLLAWLLSLGFDFFLHGGLLAELYVAPDPFLLPPEVAFRRIPLGYAAFLVLTAALYWLLARLDVRGWWRGLRFGAVAGLVLWGALGIGLYSITTAAPGLLLGWGVGQSVELGLAGGVIGALLAGRAPRRVGILVAGAFLLFVTATVVLQSLGVAPGPG